MENFIQLSYDRVVAGTETARNVVGASTSADRKLLETDSTKWVWVNYTTGNDTTGNGSSGTPYKTIVKGATDVNGTTKTVVHVGDNSTYNENITKPTQAAIGYTPTWNVTSGKTLSSTGMLSGFNIIGDVVDISGNIINCTMSGITDSITVAATCTFWCNNIVSDNAVLWTFSPGAAGTLNCFDNIFANNSLQVLEIDGSGENIIFAQNVFYGNSYLQLSNNDGDEIIYGNIFAGNTNIYCLEADTTIQFQYCIIHQEGGLNGVGNNNLDQYSKIADPLFRSREFPYNYMIAAISDNGIYNSVGVEMLPERYTLFTGFSSPTSQNAPEANSYNSVCWSPELNLFIAISSDGTNRVMKSSDGSSWSAVSCESSTWQSVCWSPELGLFCAVAQSGTNLVMTSPNGDTWTPQTASDATAWSSVCWSPELGLFCAVGVKYSTQNIENTVMTSDDGINWTGHQVLTEAYADENWFSVCWSPELGIFCAVGQSWWLGNYVMTSSDGSTWTPHSGAWKDRWQSVCWSPELGLFCTVGQDNNGRIATSPDGINWTEQTAPYLTYWKSVCWSSENSVFVAVSMVQSGNARLAYSTDGVTWAALTNPVAKNWYSIVYSPDLDIFVCVGDIGGGDLDLVFTLGFGTFLNARRFEFYSNDAGAIDTIHTVSYSFTDATIIAPYETEQNISAIDYIEHDRADGDKGIFFDKQQIELLMKWKLLKSTEAEVIKSILFSGGVIRLYPNPVGEQTYYLEGKVVRSGAFNLGASVRPGVGYIEPSLKMVLPVTRAMLDARNGVLI